MTYAGDTKYLTLSIIRSDGTAPSVTVVPSVTVIRLADQVVVVNAQLMTLIPGTQAIYTYPWAIDPSALNGDYVSLVSYASDGITVSGRMLETLTLGDSRITGVVALDSTVAKNATVAKDATVAHLTDLALVDPDASDLIQAIKLKTDNLPVDPASQTQLVTVLQVAQDFSDYQMGTWTIDKTANPQVLTVLRPSGAVIARFQLTDGPSATTRTPTS
jgi:hypothetical protein